MPGVDLPDFQKGVFFFDGSVPWMSTADFPDWTDGINVVDQSISPTQDFPDWTKVVGTVKAFPGGPPVTGYTAWWDATKITGLTDGSTVTQWNDSSPNGYNLFPHLTGPTYYSTTAAKLVNGNPAVWFSASAGYLMLTVPTPAVPQPFSVLAVTKTIRTSGTGVIPGVFGSDNTFVPRLTIDLTGTGQYTIAAGSGSVSLAGADNNVHMVIGVYDSANTNSKVILDGTTGASGICGTQGIPGGSPHMAVGASGSEATYDNLDGPLCEMIVYPFAVTTAQAATLHSYCQAKWGTP